jgi:hypothetical protein
MSSSSTLSSLTSANIMQTINSTSLATTTTGASSSNFTYSIWFYVNDWNYKYGDPKVIFGRMTSSTSSQGEDGISGKGPCPLVVLGPISNNLDIRMAVYPGAGSTESSVVEHNCAVPNIPIQRWVNLLISVYGRTMDVYLDGKLVKTCVMPGVAKINNEANVYITPAGGFSGWTSKFQYFANPTDPQAAWNIYKAGYGNNLFSNLFSKYQVSISVEENGNVTNSVTF